MDLTPSETKERLFMFVALVLIIAVMVVAVTEMVRVSENRAEAQAEAAANYRFEWVGEQEKLPGGLAQAGVVKDKETGVQYLWLGNGFAAGTTVLVDQDGKPLIEAGDSND